MKKYINNIGIYLGVLSLALGLFACGGKSESKNKTVKENLKKVSVEVVSVSPQKFTDYINTVGVVKPIESANVTFVEGGIIEEIKNDKGSNVKKDDVLFVVENDMLKANLDAAKAQYDLAQMTFEKQESIYKQNVNSEFQYLQAKYNRDQAKAAYELAKIRYNKSFVKAPIDGYVDSRNFNQGELAPPGMTVMRLINTSKVKIETGVPERYVGDVRVGQKAESEFPELEGRKFIGRVTFVSHSVTTSNRTFSVEITLDNPGLLIKPEMIANVRIERKTYESIFTVPDDALIRADNGYVLFVAIDGKAVKRKTSIIRRFENKVALSDGLNEGDKLIVVGQQNLLDGTDINIVN